MSPLPSVTFRSELEKTTRKELDQHDAELSEYLLAQHTDEGGHGDITATSIVIDNGQGSVTIDGGVITVDRPGDDPTPPNQLDGALDLRGWINIDPVETSPVPLPTLGPPPTNLVGGQLQLGNVGTSATGTAGSVGPGLRTRAQVPSYISDWSVVAASDPMLTKPCVSVVHQGTSPLGAGIPLLIRANDNGGTTPGYEIVPSNVTEGAKKVNLGSHTLGYGGSYEGFSEANARKIYARDAVYERQRTVAMGEWQAYTPTWVSDPAPGPNLGDGQLIGLYTLVGKTAHFQIRFRFGSTTSGVIAGAWWGFSLPIARGPSSFNLVMGTAWMQNAANGQHFTGTVIEAGWVSGVIAGNASVLVPVIGQTNKFILQPGQPFTWINGSYLFLSGTYETV